MTNDEYEIKEPEKIYCPVCMEELDVSEKHWTEEPSLSPKVRKRVLNVLGDCAFCTITVSMEIEYLEDI